LHIALEGILVQITIIFYYWTSCELTLPCNISQWRKWLDAICSTERDRQSRWSVARLPGCVHVL